jgi:hypothetical protein
VQNGNSCGETMSGALVSCLCSELTVAFDARSNAMYEALTIEIALPVLLPKRHNMYLACGGTFFFPRPALLDSG